jgi:hypothetical protein
MTNNATTKPSHASVPAAACACCGGWTSFGGMSQYTNSKAPVLGRVGCTCQKAMR